MEMPKGGEENCPLYMCGQYGDDLPGGWHGSMGVTALWRTDRASATSWSRSMSTEICHVDSMYLFLGRGREERSRVLRK